MIQLNDLSFGYRRNSLALRDITTEIGPGMHLLLGANGSGKTTLLKIIAGMRLAAPSMCLIDGISAASRNPDILNRTFLLTDSMTFPYRTINEMVHYHAPFFPDFDREMLHENLDTFRMTGDEPMTRFSLGNRKKAQLAYVLALRPKVLMFDEPANGLDISSRDEFISMLARSTRQDQTVIVSSHTVFDFQNIVDSVMVLSDGHLILSMPIWQITRRLAFVSDSMPIEGALFMKQALGRFNAIVANDADLETDIDFTLFYSSLQSAQAPAILSHLSK